MTKDISRFVDDEDSSALVTPITARDFSWTSSASRGLILIVHIAGCSHGVMSTDDCDEHRARTEQRQADAGIATTDRDATEHDTNARVTGWSPLVKPAAEHRQDTAQRAEACSRVHTADPEGSRGFAVDPCAV